MQVPFFTFRDFPDGIHARIEQTLVEEYRRQQFILGASVQEFERSFSDYIGVKEAVGVGNGFDALVLSLRALGVGPGDDVLLPGNSFIATINAVQQVGATPVLLDPDEKTYNLTAQAVNQAITQHTKAVIPVHLFGLPCPMPQIMQVAQEKGILVVEDCAQAHGAVVAGRQVGSFGHVNAFSFYPTKNLGAVGDAGAVVSQDLERLNFIRKYQNYGQSQRYAYELPGVNSRLDSLQAAVLSVKLPYLGQLNEERRRLARSYSQQLAGVGDLECPAEVPPGTEPVFHLYVVRTRQRDALQQYLQKKGISTLVHYPVPAHLQKAYGHLGLRKGGLPVTEALAATSLSLPLYPGMTEGEQHYVVEQVQHFFA
ncbi:DegT/DnrJ/EryC1/StrS family aminotransferase [Rufibacter quisquiliarum]|nr:DegT/DnrJ/EryC1/StrS family aminotransferase [Rufibacter quisquiliarum]